MAKTTFEKKIVDFFKTPFPRPERSRKNIIWLLIISIISNLFIYLFNPFNIANQNGPWYIDLILFSLGIVFFLSVLFIEFLFPSMFPRLFKNWTFGKAIIWYSWVVLFVGAIMFLYKSFLGGFNDFTWIEYFAVIGRVSAITFIVSFFTLGVFNYFNQKRISLLSAKENYTIHTTNGKPIIVNLEQILFVISDDNYVDIHLEINGARKKEILRSSLKNIESQIVNPVSPIYRCHRKYLININHFKIQKMNSRSMIIELQKYQDQIPVSKQYANKINSLLQIRP